MPICLQPFFADFGLPEPDHNLEVGSGTHGQQTGNIIIKYEELLLSDKPDWVIVVGDVNSTIACAIAASKLHIPVAHLEAGLRSYDMSMPEEVNRILTDRISDLLWTPTEAASVTLQEEGTDPSKIDFVGNIMIDTFEMLRHKYGQIDLPRSIMGVKDVTYGVVTFHRPSNVDEKSTLIEVVECLTNVSLNAKLIFPIHPRTMTSLKKFGLVARLTENKNIYLIDPLGYKEFMSIVLGSSFVITDSGGVQEETSYANIPCITVRPNTERPITIELGTNELVTIDNVSDSVSQILNGEWKQAKPIKYWDGHTADRVVNSLAQKIDVSI